MAAAAAAPTLTTTDPSQTMIALDVPWEAFAARYAVLASQAAPARTSAEAPVVVAAKPAAQTASAFQAISARAATSTSGWLGKIINFFRR